MSKFWANILAFLLPTASVERAVSSLRKAMNDLETAERLQAEKQVGLEQMIANLQVEAIVASRQVQDAQRIRRNIAAIIE